MRFWVNRTKRGSENIIRQANAPARENREGSGRYSARQPLGAAVLRRGGHSACVTARSADAFRIFFRCLTRWDDAFTAGGRYRDSYRRGPRSNRDGSIGNAKHFPSAGIFALIAIRSFGKRMCFMNAVNAGSRDPEGT